MLMSLRCKLLPFSCYRDECVSWCALHKITLKESLLEDLWRIKAKIIAEDFFQSSSISSNDYSYEIEYINIAIELSADYEDFLHNWIDVEFKESPLLFLSKFIDFFEKHKTWILKSSE